MRLLALICILAAGVARAHHQSDGALSAHVDEVVLTQMCEQTLRASVWQSCVGGGSQRQGYGLASIELNVPLTPEWVFLTESVGTPSSSWRTGDVTVKWIAAAKCAKWIQPQPR